MQEAAGIAEVIRVTKHPVIEIAEGVEVGGYTIQARICPAAHQYLHGLFLVKVSKPSEVAYQQRVRGSPMEDGEFSFDSGELLKVGDKLEILISPPAPENHP